jgi:hypothetical protein
MEAHHGVEDEALAVSLRSRLDVGPKENATTPSSSPNSHCNVCTSGTVAKLPCEYRSRESCFLHIRDPVVLDGRTGAVLDGGRDPDSAGVMVEK